MGNICEMNENTGNCKQYVIKIEGTTVFRTTTMVIILTTTTTTIIIIIITRDSCHHLVIITITIIKDSIPSHHLPATIVTAATIITIIMGTMGTMAAMPIIIIMSIIAIDFIHVPYFLICCFTFLSGLIIPK
jgi:hypothetical protein